MDKEQSFEYFFKNLGMMSPLSQEAQDLALPYLHLCPFEPKSHIVDAGDRMSDFYFILSGIARYFYINDEGKEYNKAFVKEGDVLMSFSSFLAQESSEYFIESISALNTVRISQKDIKYLIEHSTEWHKLYVSFLEKTVMKKVHRESELLLLDAKQRYVKFLDTFQTIENQIPNYHIASYLGITDVRLSNIRRELNLT